MRLRNIAFGLGAVILLSACGDDGTSPPPPPPPPPALQISARTPAPDVTAVETGATVTVTFDQAIDPATLTDATFFVRAGGMALPVALTYDAPTRTATAVVPFLPGASYGVEVTTELRTPAGGALAANVAWSFGTRAWERADVAAGSVGSGYYMSLAVTGNGRRHLTFWEEIVGNLKYATCTAACAAAANWQVVAVDTGGDVGTFSSVVVTGDGRVHVSYRADTPGRLKYATCAGNCNTAGNWQRLIVDGAPGAGWYTSLKADDSGRLHMMYVDITKRDLKYATCESGCLTPTDWEVVAVDTAGDVGSHNSLELDGSGRLFVSYIDLTNRDLKFAMCAANCTVAANWQAVIVESGSTPLFTSLALDGSERLHLSYFVNLGTNLKYATCAASCAAVANWQTVVVDSTGTVGQYNSLKVDAEGRLYVGYYHFENRHFRYATCAVTCTTGAHWRAMAVDTSSAGRDLSLALGVSGRIHAAYRREGAGFAYIE